MVAQSERGNRVGDEVGELRAFHRLHKRLRDGVSMSESEKASITVRIWINAQDELMMTKDPVTGSDKEAMTEVNEIAMLMLGAGSGMYSVDDLKSMKVNGNEVDRG